MKKESSNNIFYLIDFRYKETMLRKPIDLDCHYIPI